MLIGVVGVFSTTRFVAVGLLVASVPVVRVVRVFAMGHEEMKVASRETSQTKRHDADNNCAKSRNDCGSGPPTPCGRFHVRPRCRLSVTGGQGLPCERLCGLDDSIHHEKRNRSDLFSVKSVCFSLLCTVHWIKADETVGNLPDFCCESKVATGQS